MLYEELVSLLKEYGCDPGVYKRGNLYRFHVNECDNFWADGKTKLQAATKAVNNWLDHDMPLDGTAVQ